ncbi:MAG: T9SS type A sorting domain-containing protein [Bacteroidetes bacterium]|nr:T9SS type A sorting domain-containing protein [Bacteroidota bacterium]
MIPILKFVAIPIVTTQLDVSLNDSVQMAYSLCFGDSAFIGGAFQTSAGMYIDSVQNNQGCDSLVYTSLSFYSQIINIDTIYLAFYDSIFLGGAWQNQTGTYLDTLIASNLCDSILITELIMFAGIHDIASLHNYQLIVSPNPVHSQLNILYPIIQTDAKAYIYDVLGKRINESDLNPQSKSIDVSLLSPGTYFVELITSQGNYKCKFTKH